MISRIFFYTALALAPNAAAQRPRSLEELESRIVLILLRTEGSPNLRQELLSLGAREEVSGVLLRILENTRNEPQSDDRFTMASTLRVKSIGALGQLGEKRAFDLIVSVLHDKQLRGGTRSIAAKALGRIDLDRGKRELLRAFDETPEPALWPFRVEIARALISTRDRAVINKLEAWSRGERSPVARRKFEEVVAEMKRQLPGSAGHGSK